MEHRTLTLASRVTNKVALIAIFTALALGTNYAMIDIPNVKLMDSLVFIAAYLFGLRVGVATAASIWLVYGFVNPYGQDSPLLLSFLVAGECFYAIGGWLLKKMSAGTQLLTSGSYRRSAIVFGALGLLTTFAYDALTNFANIFLFVTSSIYQAFIIGMISGAPFSLFHEVSNTGFFATFVPGAIRAIKRFRPGLD